MVFQATRSSFFVGEIIFTVRKGVRENSVNFGILNGEVSNEVSK